MNELDYDPDEYHSMEPDEATQKWIASVNAKGTQPCEGCRELTASWHGTSNDIHYACGECPSTLNLPF
jgi:hypothetical protein